MLPALCNQLRKAIIIAMSSACSRVSTAVVATKPVVYCGLISSSQDQARTDDDFAILISREPQLYTAGGAKVALSELSEPGMYFACSFHAKNGRKGAIN